MRRSTLIQMDLEVIHHMQNILNKGSFGFAELYGLLRFTQSIEEYERFCEMLLSPNGLTVYKMLKIRKEVSDA